jgi:alpha-1,3-glucan synthase
MPGAPALYWGEEQALYLLDSTADNYVYGRQPMSSNRGWQAHGCYALSDSSYTLFPLGPALEGCHDDDVSLDQKDPSHPVRNIIKRMYELRKQYPVLNDGYNLEALSSQTVDLYLDGSNGTASPTGIWSVYRSGIDSVQDFNGTGQGNQGVWLVFSNENTTMDFTFDCNDDALALVSPFASSVVVKNLFYPFEEYTLANSTVTYDRDNSTGFAGCLSNLTMPAWGFKALVPKDKFTEPSPTITGMTPSHDERLLSSVELGQQQTVSIEIQFSATMNCTSVGDSLVISSSTQDGVSASINSSSISCKATETKASSNLVGQPATAWTFSAQLVDVSHGLHTITVRNVSSENGTFTNAIDRFMFRLGATDNPMVFPATANYTRNLLHRDSATNDVYISPRAPGADKFRYSRTWGSSWSSWANYTGDNVTLEQQAWSGTDKQKWSGEHVIIQYWSEKSSSSDHVQHGDLSASQSVRRWPHAFVLGKWNTWGYDNGLSSSMSLSSKGTWVFDLSAEWPTKTTINVWGMNPDGSPDKTAQYGDVDGDGVLDWLHPDTLSSNVINMTSGPGMPHMAWRIVVDDGTYGFSMVPVGSGYYQLGLSILLALIPPLTGVLALWLFKKSYYQVKFNEVGVAPKSTLLELLPAPVTALFKPKASGEVIEACAPRRTVLIATMEYEIEDWSIKVKIGGLGVMASLMGKALDHMNLVWVVPCVGGIDYPSDTPAEPMVVTINDSQYHINVQYHYLRNITFVLLDSPVFRQQSKAEPYPSRMDDLDSAIYYSAWNACIAEAIKRFPVDLYHINDYHGALAPLYLLPQTIPVSLSLHNAEFQGLWPLRNDAEVKEITKVFNLPKSVVKSYVQFGEVFNLLHAAASYLRIHQKGFGAIGVSKKYGTRALKRYPIFWGLSSIGALPNPDPTDTAELSLTPLNPNEVVIDEKAEAERGTFRVQAQEWAGLNINPNVSPLSPNDSKIYCSGRMLIIFVGSTFRFCWQMV